MTTTLQAPLTEAEAATLDRYWRAANYLAVGQIYLMDNPLLTEPLRPEHIKPRLLGHWGTTPGPELHLGAPEPGDHACTTRPMMCVIGPGHGGPAALANTWLEGTYSEVYPSVPRDAAGHAAAVPPVLVPRRRAQPRGAGDAGLDPRGRRAGLLAVARARRGVRQPGPDRGLRRRRRRGRDRPAGHELARATGSSTRPATARCCRSCT